MTRVRGVATRAQACRKCAVEARNASRFTGPQSLAPSFTGSQPIYATVETASSKPSLCVNSKTLGLD
eukprot:13501247-Alexandrium_andersonii.AAC.1